MIWGQKEAMPAIILRLICQSKKIIGLTFLPGICLIFLSFHFPVSTINPFVTVKNGQFFWEGKPYHFVGVNYWPAAFLGLKTYPGDRVRLISELDFLARKGITNIRVLVASQGNNSYPYRAFPSSQELADSKTDTWLEGLDFLLHECGKRHIKLVLYFTNQWEWSGGMGQYLEWNGYGITPLPKSKGWTWENYCAYMARFYSCQPCKEQLNALIKKVVTRKNTITGIPYVEDPAIFSWELCNEPRPMETSARNAFFQWAKETTSLIQSLDPNHMITTGSEGDVAFGYDMAAFEQLHAFKTIDYVTIHIWPKNWNWFPDTSIAQHFPTIIAKSEDYLQRHLLTAKKLQKPLVLEEFGLPRDGHQFAEGTTAHSRNRYVSWALSHLKKDAYTISGINFWAFGGLVSFPKQGEFWQQGAPFRGDPPQEEQGLNSLFGSDSLTWQLMKTSSISFQKQQKSKP